MDDMVSSEVFQPLRSSGRIIWTSKVAYFWVRGLIRPILSTDHGRDYAYHVGKFVNLYIVY